MCYRLNKTRKWKEIRCTLVASYVSTYALQIKFMMIAFCQVDVHTDDDCVKLKVDRKETKKVKEVADFPLSFAVLYAAHQSTF